MNTQQPQASGQPEQPEKGGKIRPGKQITAEEAIRRTRIFREEFIQKTRPVPEEVKGNAFAKEDIMAVLRQPGCEGIRIYHSINPDATDKDGNPAPIREVILVGIDGQYNDLLTPEDYPDVPDAKGCNPFRSFLALPASPVPQRTVMVANPHPCPNMCGRPNGLNS
jgi:hypothetical protein